MELKWMGRYRDLMAALVFHANMASRAYRTENHIMDDIYLSPQEWQVLEFLVEHDNEKSNMIRISNNLGIPQSSFSKITKKLCEKGLAQKFQSNRNRKDIYLRPTEYGIKAYFDRAERVSKVRFAPMFSALEQLTDEDLAAVTKALRSFNRFDDNTTEELVPVPFE
ncbi:MAG: MarR family transcriptional regulator [Anaerolineaceae bacterium]|nr:MarR family transcriptional regulator [Anaerolineaceae bacterium]